jgi:hypothetical protein
MMRAVPVGAGVAAVALATAGMAAAYVHFRTPGKAAYCYVAAGEVNYTRDPALVCFTPNDGFTVRMRSGGRVSKQYVPENKRNYTVALKVLGFGSSFWALDSGDNTYTGYGTPPNTERVGKIMYRCWSRSTGLTCENRVGHGWWLGRFHGYRTY